MESEEESRWLIGSFDYNVHAIYALCFLLFFFLGTICFLLSIQWLNWLKYYEGLN